MKRTLRVLFVEDTEDDMLLLIRAFRTGGYDLTYERVETEAAMRAALHSQPWDLIISDYSLPRFSAPAALAIVKEHGIDLPFLIVSGTINEEAAVTALRAGAHDFITKDRLARLLPAVDRELREAAERKARHAAEHALSESEQRFTRLAENAPDIIYRFQYYPSRNWDYISPAATRIAGYTPQDFYNNPRIVDKLVHAEDQAQIAELEQHLSATNAPVTTTIRWIRPNGSIVWLEHRVIPLRDDNGRLAAVEGIARDITSRVETDRALKQSEERYRRLVVTSPDAIIQTDLDGTILFCNEQAVRLYGRESADALLWNSTLESIVPEDRAHVLAMLEHTLQSGQIETSEYTLLRSDQGRIPIEANTSVVHGANGEPGGYIMMLRDVTERKRAAADLDLQMARLAALRAIDIAIMASLDLRVTLNVCLDQVTAQLGADATAVQILDPHMQTFRCAAVRGFRTSAMQRSPLRVSQEYAGRAVLERRTICVPDLHAAPDFQRSDMAYQEGFASYYAAPLITKGQVTGVLEVFHRTMIEPDQSWLEFFETLAGQIAIAIDNATLFDNLQRSNADLILAYDTTLAGWSRALDLRDKETEGHSERVTELSLRLAEAMHMTPSELVHMRRGALLHDIGKLAIPDRILLKPGKLSDEEWTVMRLHPVYAHEWLWPITYLRPALDIPYSHHEKWDGSGYPRGLRGEQIPLAARIFALADGWDAMRSDRPYRAAMTVEAVREYVLAQSGKHFDPQIVSVFLDLEETQAPA
jgi:PAS domain S-box-containing protein